MGLLQMWPQLIQKAKEGGLDVIQTYVFWNGHEPQPGKVKKFYFFFLLTSLLNIVKVNNLFFVLVGSIILRRGMI